MSRMIAVAVLIAVILAPTSRTAIAQPPTPLTATDWSAPHMPGRLLVKLADFSPANAERLGAETGMPLAGAIPQLGIAIVEVNEGAEPKAPGGSGRDLAAAAGQLEALSDVEWAEPDYAFALDLVPNDPYFASAQAPYLNRLEMPAAWDFTAGRSDVIIAVLDTGVDLTHPDLASGIWTNPLEIPGNGIDDEGNGFVDDVHGWNFALNNNAVADDYGHGTHVSGIAAARINNGVGIAGMAGGATIMPVKVFFPPPKPIGAYEDLIRAIIYATDNGARIINMSLGATSYSRGEEAAVNYAWERGVVVVAAAGNTWRNSYNYPAAHPNAIAVAATDANDNWASFSTYGDFVDVAAPGSGVFSTYWGGGYTYMSGTSMASPHVAGLAALLFSRNTQLTNAQVRALIEQNTDDLGSPGWDPYFGHGRINARKALAAVPQSPQPSPSPTPHPPLSEWPAGCVDLISDGDFEGSLAAWQVSGSIGVDSQHPYSGTRSLHFMGGPNASGTVSQTLYLLYGPAEATLWFAYRIETVDSGWGTTPEMPYDDWLTAEFRTQGGASLASLLRTGNTADTSSSGLPWDRYLYRMLPTDVAPLLGADPVEFVLTAKNDSDNLPTDFWVDAVRFCYKSLETPSPTTTLTPSVTPTITPAPTEMATPRVRVYLPLLLN